MLMFGRYFESFGYNFVKSIPEPTETFKATEPLKKHTLTKKNSLN